jgi:LytS/YehU family sensor histidine kinase
LNIEIRNNSLFFNLTNSKPPQPLQSKTKAGIGLLNVKRRLSLLYPGKHELVISTTDSVFNVQLQLDLAANLSAVKQFQYNPTRSFNYT